MRKQILIVSGVLFAAASVDASTLSLRWRDTASDMQSITSSSTAVLEVVLEVPNFQGAEVSGVIFSLEPTTFDEVIHVSNADPLPNWSIGNLDVGNPLGSSTFAAFAQDPATDWVRGGVFVLGTIALHLVENNFQLDFDIAFDHSAANQVFGANGQPLSFTASTLYAAYSGYWIYGKGSPGVTQMSDVLSRDPLNLFDGVPEPASLGLFALGGFALFMRRR